MILQLAVVKTGAKDGHLLPTHPKLGFVFACNTKNNHKAAEVYVFKFTTFCIY